MGVMLIHTRSLVGCSMLSAFGWGSSGLKESLDADTNSTRMPAFHVHSGLQNWETHRDHMEVGPHNKDYHIFGVYIGVPLFWETTI